MTTYLVRYQKAHARLFTVSEILDHARRERCAVSPFIATAADMLAAAIVECTRIDGELETVIVEARR